MDRCTRNGRPKSDSHGSTIIPGKTAPHLFSELLCTCRTDLLASHAEIGEKKLVAECAAFFSGFGGLQALENIVSEPDGTLIKTKPDVATHGDPLEFFSIEPQPSLGVERHEWAVWPVLRK